MSSIKNTLFNDIRSSDPGGAALFSCLFSLEVVSSSFISCSSSAEVNSSQRPLNWIGGGGFFADVSSGSISNCFFLLCSCPTLASAYYICTPIESRIEIYCNSNALCSSSKSTCVAEKGTPKIRNDNTTSSESNDIWSSFHIGRYPENFDVRFCSFNNFSFGISFSNVGHQQKTSDLLFINMRTDGAAITAWRVNLEASNVLFYNCSSGLIVHREEGTCTLYDSIIGSISTAEITISKNVSTSNLQITVNYECPIQGMILCSKQILIRKTRFIGLFLFHTIPAHNLHR